MKIWLKLTLVPIILGIVLAYFANDYFKKRTPSVEDNGPERLAHADSLNGLSRLTVLLGRHSLARTGGDSAPDPGEGPTLESEIDNALAELSQSTVGGEPGLNRIQSDWDNLKLMTESQGGEGGLRHQELIDIVDGLRGTAFAKLQTSLQNGNGSAMVGREPDRTTGTVLLASGGVLAVLLLLVFSSGINRQLQAITATFSDIGIGEFEARADIHTSDELAGIAENLNAMLDSTLSLIQSQEERDRIQESIRKLLDEISGVADGDLTREADVTAEVTGAIADAFNLMISQLREIIGNVSDTTLQVSSYANEIQSTAEYLAQGSSSQSEQIDQTTKSLAQIAKSIQEVSKNANLSAEVAREALQNANKGTTIVQNTIQGMGSIREQVQETAKRIKRLGESSQQIGEIVQLIGDIADRTSILALNASIQAAMAGEAGRGFAVVAEEVERLAERATGATKQIETIINTIQTETNQAVAAMEDTTQEVIKGSGLANDAGHALEEIGSVSKRLAELIQIISMASQDQAKGSDEIARSMTDISEITRQTTTGTQQAALSMNDLVALAETLNESVSRFQIPGQA